MTNMEKILSILDSVATAARSAESATSLALIRGERPSASPALVKAEEALANTMVNAAIDLGTMLARG